MPFSTPYLIETPRCLLRLPEASDLSALYAIHSVPEVNRYLPYITWTSMANAQTWLDLASSRLQKEEALQLVIIEKASNTLIGTCVLFRFDHEQGSAELGYALGQTFWGHGYMREALPAFLRYGFFALNIRRIEAAADSGNLASHKLLLALGFSHEGLRRQNWLNKGEIVDSNVYGLLRNEWEGG